MIIAPIGNVNLASIRTLPRLKRPRTSACNGLRASIAVRALIALVSEIKLTILGHVVIPSDGADDLGSYLEVVPLAV